MRKRSIGTAAVLVAGTAAIAWACNARAGAGDAGGQTGVEAGARASGGSHLDKAHVEQRKTGSSQGPATESGEKQSMYYYFGHGDSGHRLVPEGQTPQPQTQKAGPNVGTSRIPRAGRETVINFQEGDPDKPIVTGNTNPKERRGERRVP
ncbi:MAG TPA: phage baseplate assembly protein V [Burkholderiales bacterium]|nr:phage baseplate assembly protein V [Burkholderiales bacterium]